MNLMSRTRAEDAADDARRSTRHLADDTLENLRHGADRTRAEVSLLARRGADRVREMTDGVREQALRAGDRTAGYVRDEPMKAVLMAAVAGAAVALLVRMLTSRSRY
jgi:ElaB/YqjD/DUF883 family membrane-anchored ribosome-binding protein